MNEEIYIKFKNGIEDWIDPVETCEEMGDLLVVDNGLHTYEYPLANIESYVRRPKHNEADAE